ncbi:MAG: hypothetical protein FWD53_02990 [Phycisphaerales bacterium]|nr:hypothetical protein [Phycisphaerales bacterium]
MTDQQILRNLAKQYADIAADPINNIRRDLWRAHNSLKRTRVLIYTRAFAFNEMPESHCQCEDPFFRRHEYDLRYKIYWASLQDDCPFEPWLAVNAITITPPAGIWGVPMQWHSIDQPGSSRRIDPPLKDESDLEKLVTPRHYINEEKTAQRFAQMQDAIGDILHVVVDRGPAWRTWHADLSSDLGHLRGIEEFMWDIADRPEWLHRLMAFLRDGVLKAHAEAEAAGDWSLINHINQAVPYAEELPDPPAPPPTTPSATPAPTPLKHLWTFCSSQETTLLGPAQFDEFILQYQLPIVSQFGLISYGCCEDLTNKIDVLRQIPNLRRIAVAPVADVAKCAEKIRTDYVLSYRPSPSDMVGYDFSPDRIRRILKRDLEASRGCIVDITLKDVETVERDPTRMRRWMQITREILEEMGM